MNLTILQSLLRSGKAVSGLPRLITFLCLSLLFLTMPVLNQARAQDTANLTLQQKVELKKKQAKEKEDKVLQAAALKAVNELKPKIDTLVGKAVQAKLDTIEKEKAKASNSCSNGQCTIMIVVIIVISLVSLAVSAFLILSAIFGPKDKQYALGLPDGSIRAIIAVITIVFYILVSITLSMFAAPSSAIATDLTKTLGILVVAVSAFYFGSKTAEQGAKTATETLSKAMNANSTTDTVVPVAVINAAIDANKATWLTLYGAQDIIAGKKQAAAVTNDLDCIVFIVAAKGAIPTDVKVIPPFIVYNHQGKTYNIPTDVQTR